MHWLHKQGSQISKAIAQQCSLLTAFVALLIIAPQGLKAQEWTLVWADEFEYNGLPDPSKWVYDVGGGGWGNNELQFYTENRLENARVANGVLTIEARMENFSGRNYTSARLLTRGKGDWLYGRFEVRAKLPGGRGVWPAVWMLPTDWEYGGWPASGEIDIMEYVGYDPNRIHFTVHTGAYNHSIGTQRGASSVFNDPENNFYTYAAEWYPDRIDFMVDDVIYFTFPREANATSAQWPFDKRFHLILNIAIGGNWGGAQGIDNSIFPQTYEIEYVRVYKSKETTVLEGVDKVYPNQKGISFRIMEIEGWEYEWIAPEGVEIIKGRDSSEVLLNWGCESGFIKCRIAAAGFVDTVSQKVMITPPSMSSPMFYENNQGGLVFTVPSMHSTTYEWTVPADALVQQGMGTNSISVRWGSTTDNVRVSISNSCIDTLISRIVLPKGQYPYPNPTSPHALPGIINATNYDYGGQGVAYHDFTLANEGPGPRQDERVDTEYGDNGGPNVGWIPSGEWLEFTIRVETTGWYRVAARLASNNSGTRGPIGMIVNGEERAQLVPPFTNAWNNFRTETEEIYLYSTDTLLRVDMGAGGFNLGNMNFTFLTTVIEPSKDKPLITVSPNPFDDLITINSEQSIALIEIFTISGQLIGREHPMGRQYQHNVCTSKLAKGVYLLKVTLSNGKAIGNRIVK